MNHRKNEKNGEGQRSYSLLPTPYPLLFNARRLVPLAMFSVLFLIGTASARADFIHYSKAQLMKEVQKRAALFFWEQADPITGLVKDRAGINGETRNQIASIASTGYALAALPVAVENGWRSYNQAELRALLTLNYLLTRFPHQHGWFYHFVNARTGAREWQSEVSSIDTVLLVLGALVCGQYFQGDVQAQANALYDRLDWQWMLTNGGSQPQKITVSMGWSPENGFLPYDWADYCELMQLYLLGMGAATNPLPSVSWDGWQRGRYTYGGLESLAGGPIFLHQMSHLYYDFFNCRDRQEYDYWVSSVNAIQTQRQFVSRNYGRRRGYSTDFFGLNASDGPNGYKAYGIPAPDDGTLSPTGAIAATIFDQAAAESAALRIYEMYGRKWWGRYGFGNAFNPSRSWFDPDVIGIDLGMALLAIENQRTRLIWNLLASHPSTQRGRAAAGLRVTSETGDRPLKR